MPVVITPTETIFGDVVDTVTCANCGAIVSVGYTTQGVCHHCIRNCNLEHLDLKLCHVCKQPIPDLSLGQNLMDRDGNLYCFVCYSNETFECTHCGDIIPMEDMSMQDNLCIRCRSYYSHCSNCDELHPIEEMTDGLCSYCDDSYGTCDNCGCREFSDDMREYDGDYVCQSCYDELCSRGPIKSYSYKPDPIFKRDKTKEETKIKDFYGVELEVENTSGDCYTRDAAARILNEVDSKNIFYIKEDGSLNNGFEIVTHPGSLLFHKNRFPWEEICNFLVGLGFKSNNTTTCGLHVHISRRALTTTEMIRFGIFVNTQVKRLEIFSRRRECSFAKFKKVAKLKDISKPGDRYEAINWQNLWTIEVRMFKGTLKYQTVLASIELCHAIVHFVKTISSIKIANKEVAWEEFTKYILGNVKLYKELIVYMKSKNLI